MDRIPTKLIGYICAVMLLAWAGTAAGVELYIPALKAVAGESVSIPVMIDQVDNLAGIKVVMTYDAHILTFKKATKTEHTSSLMHIANDKKPGLLIVVMAGARGIKGKKFPILSLEFGVKEGLKGNHTTQLNITELQMMSDQLKDIKGSIKIDPLTVLPATQPAEKKEAGKASSN